MEDSTIRALVESFVLKLQLDKDSNPLDRILGVVQTKRKPTRGLGLLYFILMDFYLENIDHIINETIKKSGLNCFWGRCLNSAILGFSDDKKKVQYHEAVKHRTSCLGIGSESAFWNQRRSSD